MTLPLCLRFVLTLLLLAPASLPAAVNCAEVVGSVDEIRAERDRDAEAGVAAARELLAQLADSQLDCLAGEVLAQAALASNLHVAGQLDEALSAVSQALGSIDRLEQPAQRAEVYRTAGVVYWEMDAHDDALAHFQSALEASRAAGDLADAARAAGNIGNLHNTLGNWEDAERYHRQALEAFEAEGIQPGVAGTLINLGALSHRRALALEAADQEDEARQQHRANLDYNRRALEMFESLENPRGIAYAADNVARALVSLDRAEEAMTYHAQSLALRRDVGDLMGVIQSRLTEARIEASLGRNEAALDALASALSDVPSDNSALRRQLLEQRLEILAGSGRWLEAFRVQEELMALQESAASDEITARAEEIEARYRAEQLSRELALERARAELSEQRARRQQVISLASILTALLLLLIAVLIYNRYRLGRRLSRDLDRAARSDPLTGLPNRRDMSERIAQAIARLDDSGEVATLVMADIDRFKQVNDRFGHQAGDRALVHVAELLRQQLRGRDHAARWGGEEFLLLLPATDAAGAVSVCENLRGALRGSPPQVDGRAMALTMTFGVIELKRGMDLNNALKAVDDAMYAGKSGGRDRIVSAGAEELG